MDERWPVKVTRERPAVSETAETHLSSRRFFEIVSLAAGLAFMPGETRLTLTQSPEGCDPIERVFTMGWAVAGMVIAHVHARAALEEELEAEMDGAM